MIRKIEAGSIDIIEPMWVSLNEMHKAFDKKIGQPVRTTTWPERRKQLIDKSGFKVNIELLYENSQPVGYCYSTISRVGLGEVESVFVEAPFRSRGYGKLLIESALSFFDENKAAGIKIWVHPANTRATSFYWQFGFGNDPVMKRLTRDSLL
jgi:GNAT superfamily N-acetyltransferase